MARGRSEVQEPPPRLLDELRYYFGEAESACGVRCSLGHAGNGSGSGDPEQRVLAGVHDPRAGESSPSQREREAHRAIVSLTSRQQATLRAYHEPRRWPRDVWAWGDMIGVVMLTDVAIRAHREATAPKGRRQVWRQGVRAAYVDSETLQMVRDQWFWAPATQDASEAPSTRQDGLMDWLGREAVRKDRRFCEAARKAGNKLLDGAWRAYEAARGQRREEARDGDGPAFTAVRMPPAPVHGYPLANLAAEYLP